MPASPVSGERRHVTLMFCDLVDSTPLSQRLDPEDLAQVVLEYNAVVEDAVRSFEGEVVRYMGDGVLVQFGYPQAHEDDPERAVETGLAIVAAMEDLGARTEREVGERLRCRIGIHSGLAVVGVMGSSDRSDISIFGDTPNIAARVEGAARPGTVAITEDTAVLLRHRFELVDERTPELKGVERPLVVYTVVRPTTSMRPGGNVLGRADLLSRLNVAWHAVTAQRRLQSATVRGPAGVGKTRLVMEHAVSAAIPEDRCFVHRSNPLDQSTPFRFIAKFAEHARSTDPSRSLPSALADLAEGDPADRGISAEERYRAIVDAGVSLLKTFAREPTLIVLDDFQWLDASSVEVMHEFIARCPDTSVLVVATVRDEANDGRAIGEELEVPRLNAADSRSLLLSILGDRDVSEETFEEIIECAAGIPLYLEELGRATRSDANRLVPTSLRSAVTGRLDRIPNARDIAQALAVLATPVAPDILTAFVAKPAAEVDAGLALLDEHGFIERHDENISLRHALIADSIYDAVLVRRRRSMHEAAGEVLAARWPDGGITAEQIAFHYSVAHRGDDGGAWYLRAAQLAARQGASTEATMQCRAGLDALHQHGDATGRDALTLTITLGNALMAAEGYGSSACLPVWQEGARIAEALGDTTEMTSALNGEAVYWFFNADSRRCASLARRQIEIGERDGNRIAELRGRVSLAIAELYLGHPRATLEHATRGVSLYQDDDFWEVTYGFGTDEAVTAYTSLALANWQLGEVGESHRNVERAQARAEEIASPISRCLASMTAGVVALQARDARGASAAAERCDAVAARYGLTFYRAVAALIRSGSLALAADANAVDMAGAALIELASAGVTNGASLGWWVVALTLASANRDREVIDVVDGALAASAVNGEQFLDAELLRFRAAAEARLGMADAAIATLRDARADALARQMTGVVTAIDADIASHMSGVPRPSRSEHRT